MRKLVVFLFILACSAPEEQRLLGTEEDWMEWRKNRLDRLKTTWGYVNLAGLYWLEEGENTAGSNTSNDIVFPLEAPNDVGLFTVENGQVSFTSAMGPIEIDSAQSESGLVFGPLLEEPILMRSGRYLWYVLERSGKLGVRLLDLEHPNLSRSIDLEYYPYNTDFITEATYVEYPIPRKILISDVLGLQSEVEIPGQLQFVLNGQNFTMEVMPEGDEFFLIFFDETSTIETYGSGRYMYAKNPGPGGKTILDFNKSYCPPCAFTDFATCPIPPPENRLRIAIKAGEKDFHWPEGS